MKRPSPVFRLPVLAALCVVCAGWSGTLAAAGLDAARGELLAAQKAHSRAAAEFEAAHRQGGLSAAEIDDYHAFLDRLSAVVADRCREVLRLKTAAGDSGPEPGCNAAASAPSPSLSFPNEQTEEERIKAMDRQLGGSLSEFDEMLLREMEEVTAARRGSPDAGGGSGADADGAASGGETGGDTGEAAGRGEQGDATAARTAAGAPRAGDRREDQELEKPPAMTQVEPEEEGGRRPRTAAVKPDPVPGGDDDDVVARQLREAAESESDPELRAKLWEEYRRYKGEQAQTQ